MCARLPLPWRSSSFAVALATALLLPALFASAPPAWAAGGQLEIHTINVQQGAATLVVGPGGTTLLMDSGDNFKGDDVVRYLRSVGIEPEDGLDYTLATHMDSDHIGGFDEVIAAGYDVRLANYYNGGTRDSGAYRDYLAAVQATTAALRPGAPPQPQLATVGQVIDLGGGARLTVVAVDGEILGHGRVPSTLEPNDRSIGVLIEMGGFDFVSAGDLGGGDDDSWCTGRETDQKNLETPLARAITPGGGRPLLGPEGVDVLQVNHHGSASSTNSDWMNLLRPEVAVISVGSGRSNRGHPTKAVVENVLGALASACVTADPALVLQTDDGSPVTGDTSFAGFSVGDIAIRTDGRAEYHVRATGPERAPDERVLAGIAGGAAFPLDEGPDDCWFEPAAFPGYRMAVEIGEGQTECGAEEELCLPETVCVSGALPGRSEMFLRLIGPRPNGFLQVNLVRFTVSRVVVRIEQTATGVERTYELPAILRPSTELTGLVDREAFVP